MTPISAQSTGPGEPRSPNDRAVAEAVEILEAHRIMAISTVRPDGWPQTTIVGYANKDLSVYFMILRSSQKYLNIKCDDRVSIAVGDEPADIHQAKAIYAGATAHEITDAAERDRAWTLLEERHPNLGAFELPGSSDAAVMRATCRHVSLVDYTKGLGHTEAFTAQAGPVR